AQKDDLLNGRLPITAKKSAGKIKKSRNAEASKPHPDFPLFAHSRGYWAKKVRQKLHYFGKIEDDPDGEQAINLWLEQKDDLLAGRTPRIHPEGFTVRELCDRFLVNRRGKMESNELTLVSFQDYFQTCKRIIDFFGPT